MLWNPHSLQLQKSGEEAVDADAAWPDIPLVVDDDAEMFPQNALSSASMMPTRAPNSSQALIAYASEVARRSINVGYHTRCNALINIVYKREPLPARPISWTADP